MSAANQGLAVALFSELLATDVLARQLLSASLPKGMELNQFSVLNHLSRQTDERTPAHLAKTFNVTRGAMTNTLSKLEWAGYIHIRPDWQDARSKRVKISDAGRKACDAAIEALAPVLNKVVDQIGSETVRAALPVLREMRAQLARI
ncbi:MAG: MarR family transcriptional regulator [Deltaproteobacteria bacterium]